jgi:hypothetical protein
LGQLLLIDELYLDGEPPNQRDDLRGSHGVRVIGRSAASVESRARASC